MRGIVEIKSFGAPTAYEEAHCLARMERRAVHLLFVLSSVRIGKVALASTGRVLIEWATIWTSGVAVGVLTRFTCPSAPHHAAHDEQEDVDHQEHCEHDQQQRAIVRGFSCVHRGASTRHIHPPLHRTE